MSLQPRHGDLRPPSARFVAIVADGNRRWASSRRLPVSAGYAAGADTLRERLHDAIDFGIEELTVYSFSTENWSRPAQEIGELISILATRIEEETPKLHREGVRMRFIGRRDDGSKELGRLMDWAESLTRANRRITLCVAFNYGGRAEILDAAKRFQGGTEEDFRRCFYAPDLRDPDLIIRTGGEQRLSNYLLWQAAYSELVFREEMWPDFSRTAFEESITQFAIRSRRFGGRAAEAPARQASVGAHQIVPRGVTTAVDDRSPRMIRQVRLRVTSAHLLALVAASCLAVTVMAASAVAHTLAPSRHAHTSRVLNATDTAHLRYISASGSLLYEEGKAVGTLPGSMRVHLNVGTTFSGSFTIYANGGSIKGHGSAAPHGSGTYESFSGTLTVTGGTGRYAHAHGHGGLYGTFDRDNYALVIKTTGSLSY